MNKASKLQALLIGVVAYFFNKFTRIDNNVTVFGGGNGDYYSDNSKYLFEYYLENSKKKCWWITRNHEVYQMLKMQNKPVLWNYSLKGIITVCKAKVVIICTSRIDIMYVYLKSGRQIINLFHGMPLKKIIYDYDGNDQKRGHLFDRLWNKFVSGFKWENIDITLSSSDYYSSVIKSAFRVDNILVNGLPRNDYFFNNSIPLNKKLFEINSVKKIISYLPTHRKFGIGKQPETPFLDNEEFKSELIKHETVLIHKPHYNVHKEVYHNSEAITEFAPGEVDVLELLKFSDILITDFSSCYVDYILLDRPVIFYRYDNYTEEDTGLYEKIENLTKNIGPVCSNEHELKTEIMNILSGNDKYKHSRAKVKNILHEDINGRYSEKLFSIIDSLQ